mgnify:CR=1 FL=1
MTERYAAELATRSARATRALGAQLGKLLAAGDVVALVGDLGAGKTQLVRGACDGAGVAPEEVSSPSFAARGVRAAKTSSQMPSASEDLRGPETNEANALTMAAL